MTLMMKAVQVWKTVDTNLVMRSRVELNALVLQGKFQLYHNNQMHSQLHRNHFYPTDALGAHINI
jgi:hypothetical protein